VLLIVVIAAVVLIRILAGNAPGDASFTLDVFKVAPGTGNSALFLGIVFGLLSFAGFEAAATLGEEASDPRRDIPRAILGTAIFGGVYFTVVTAIEMMGFGTDSKGVNAFVNSPALMGDLGTSYVGSWVGDLITLGAAVSAYACCLACVVGASRMVYAIARDLNPAHPLARTGPNATPVNAAIGVTGVILLIAVISATAGQAKPFDTFFWSGTIGTLILLVAYVLATLGAIKLVFVDRLMHVPRWQIVIPIAAIVMLGYTIYRNIWPWPTTGAAQWFPIISFGWLVVVTIVVVLVPNVPQRLARGIQTFEGIPQKEAI
jgi:amino acid transporter